MLLGYSVGWKQGGAEQAFAEFNGATANICAGMHVFISLQDAQTVMAAEKLKSPTMEWHIYEVHSTKNFIETEALSPEDKQTVRMLEERFDPSNLTEFLNNRISKTSDES